MKFAPVFAVAMMLSLVSQVAAAQEGPVRPALSTSMQRTCQSETTGTVLMREGQSIAHPMPTIERQERRLSVRATDAGLVFEHLARSPSATVMYTFTTSTDGVVKTAEVTGIPVEMGLTAAQEAALARTAADDLPERLLVGRSFLPGDSYYPEPLRQDLIGRVMESLGMPFPVEGSLDVAFRGEVEHRGRRAWVFDGTLTVEGSGLIDGRRLGLRQAGTARVVHDVETGLVLNYDIQMQNSFDVDGKPFGLLKSTDVWHCEIGPQ